MSSVAFAVGAVGRLNRSCEDVDHVENIPCKVFYIIYPRYASVPGQDLPSQS